MNDYNYNQTTPYKLTHPLHTMSYPIPTAPQPLASLYNTYNPHHVNSPTKRKGASEHSSSSFPQLKKSKSTPIPAKRSFPKQIKAEDTESPEEEAKSRQRSLERNRLAASKCRQRKKEWIEELAHKAERMSRENEHLKQLLFQLKEEALFLKTQLMMHKGYDTNLYKGKEYFSMF